MSEINWQTFIKNSLIITIVGIIYLLITINSIVLVKIFPILLQIMLQIHKNLILGKQSILDYFFFQQFSAPLMALKKIVRGSNVISSKRSGMKKVPKGFFGCTASNKQ
ncbi:MAG: hypothetical protein CM15mP58_07590 [Burkholderiaceae bacterium]|nr:MAG: hypothetical protein CM15mP58_07590 [Burkholderiaceae bacterium]